MIELDVHLERVDLSCSRMETTCQDSQDSQDPEIFQSSEARPAGPGCSSEHDVSGGGARMKLHREFSGFRCRVSGRRPSSTLTGQSFCPDQTGRSTFFPTRRESFLSSTLNREPFSPARGMSFAHT